MRHHLTIKAWVVVTIAAGMLGGAAWSSTQPQRSHQPGARP